MADAFPAVRTWVFEEIHESTHHNDDRDRFTALKNAMEGDASVALVHKHKSGLLANRPAAGQAGRVYVATDGTAERAFFDDGTVWWETPLLDSTPAAGDLPYFDGAKYALKPLGTAFQQLRVNAAADGFEWGNDPPIIKAATETINNSDTLQNDDDLLFAIGANETWVWEMMLRYEANASADLQVHFTAPAGAAGRWYCAGVHASLGPITDSGAYGVTIFNLDGAQDGAMFWGIVRNGATPGNMQLQWAQAIAHASDAKVLLDSYLTARRV